MKSVNSHARAKQLLSTLLNLPKTLRIRESVVRRRATRVMRSRKMLPLVLVVFLSVTGRGVGQDGTAEARPDNATPQKDALVDTLQPGKPVERKLAGGEEHSYWIAIEAGQYLNGVVEQRGIDVVVTLSGPDGKQLLEVDSPNGTHGPEPLVTVIETGGRHGLSIRSLEKDAAAGSYEVKVAELRAATSDDRVLLEAGRHSREAAEQRAQGKLDAAIPLAERALALREKILGQQHPDVVNAVRELGWLYFEQGNFSKAEPLLQRVLAMREASPGSNQLDLAKAQNDLAELYLAKGEYAKAEPLFQRSLAIREKMLGPEHPDVATSLNNLGGVYYEQAAYATVEPLWERALVIVEKTLGAEHPDVADALHSLASLYAAKGDYGKAEPMYLRSLAIREKVLGPEHPYLSLSLNNLASLYSDKGDYAKAEPLLQRSLAIREKALGPEHPGVGASLNSLGFHYFSVREYAKAEPMYERALAIWEKALGPEHAQVSIAINNLALLYYVKGAHEKAEPLWQRSLAIREKALGPNHPDVAKALHNLGFFYSDRGETAKSEAFFQRALAIREQVFGQFHPEVAEAYSGLAFLYAAKGDAAKAIAARARGNDITEHNLALNLNIGSERQKLLYLATLSAETDSTISLHLQIAPNNPMAARLALLTILRRKGRALDVMTDQIGALRRRAAPQDRALLDQLSETRAQLATLVLRGPGKNGPIEHQQEVKRLEEQIEKLEAEVGLRSAAFRAGAKPVKLETIQPLIPRSAALVEFLSYRPFNPKYKKLAERFGARRYVAYVLRPTGNPLWVDLGEAKQIDIAIDSLRAALRDRSRKDTRSLARALDELVMRPVRGLLGVTRHILLSPDGSLNLIPFGALVDERNRYLIEKYLITYVTSGRDLLRLEGSAESRQAPLILADPLFDGNESLGNQAVSADQTGETSRSIDFSNARFKPLPATADEAKDLSLILPDGQAHTGAQATEEVLKQVKGARILHVATHGFFLTDQLPERTGGREIGLASSESLQSDTAGLENPLLRSGLALAGANRRQGGGGEDGILTALEAAGLDLWGTKLVVLSACETGVGEVKNGDGVYGLRRALVLAGAESQVMSLWQVSDKATRDLMVEYYINLRAGEGRTEALRQVQLAMLKSKLHGHPFYWASFIQSGAWREMKIAK